MHDVVIRGEPLSTEPGHRPAVEILDRWRPHHSGGGVGPGKREMDVKDCNFGLRTFNHHDAQVTWDPYPTPSSWHRQNGRHGNGRGFCPRSTERREAHRFDGGVEISPVRHWWREFSGSGNRTEGLDAPVRKVPTLPQIPHGALGLRDGGTRSR